jgi:ATP-binding cassette subfamily F protein 3
MLSKSNFLLLDEPTNHLDIDSKEVLEEALLNYTGTIFTISHDRYFLNTVVDKIFLLDKEGITEYLGNYDYYIEKKKQTSDLAQLDTEESQSKTKTQLKEEKRKEREKKESEKKNRNRLKNIEKDIEEIEIKIEELDALLCLEEIYSNPEKSRQVNAEKVALEDKLSNLYLEWEEFM